MDISSRAISEPASAQSIPSRANAVQRVTAQTRRESLPELRLALVNAQHALLENTSGAVLVQIMGNDRLACDKLIDRLHHWMDARYLLTEVFLSPSAWEAAHPRFWRYWKCLPPRGQIGIFGGGWPFDTLLRRLSGEIDADTYQRYIEYGCGLERALASDGMTHLKFWLHGEKAKLRRQLKRIPKREQDPLDHLAVERYDDILELAEAYLHATDAPQTPWQVLSTTDQDTCEFVAARAVRTALEQHLAGTGPVPAERQSEQDDRTAVRAPMDVPPASIVGPRLEHVDLSARLSSKHYRKRLAKVQRKLSRRQKRAREANMTAVLVFEGWDAAGKGGAIRRVIRPLPARDYRIVPIAAPTDEETAQHYLWRFWRRLPRPGRMVIFDRSWYGRVLVERVEGFASPQAWRRAYDEINQFERQLTDHGMVVVKFWLHISSQEQLRRFEARENTPYKEYKITDEDFRNRARWEEYTAAIDEMFARTSTTYAPWHVIAAEDKRWARVRVVEAVSKQLRDAVRRLRD